MNVVAAVGDWIRRFPRVGALPERCLTIRIDAPNRSVHGPLFVAGRKRLATVTAVRFLSHERLLATHLVGKRLYLIRYDLAARTHTVECEVPTTFGGDEVVTELVDFDGRELVATSSFSPPSVTLYRLEGTRLTHFRDLPIPDPDADGCHGVKFVPGRDVVCATCTNKERQIYFLSTTTGEILYQFGDGAWRPKDVSFVDDGRMVVISSSGNPGLRASREYRSKISLLAFDLQRRRHTYLAEVQLDRSHVDSCVHQDGRVYFSSTDRRGDCVRVGRVGPDRIVVDTRLSNGYSFPHGVDVLPGAKLLAVTNYGTSDIVITRLT
jgi:hypothetical protein